MMTNNQNQRGVRFLKYTTVYAYIPKFYSKFIHSCYPFNKQKLCLALQVPQLMFQHLILSNGWNAQIFDNYIIVSQQVDGSTFLGLTATDLRDGKYWVDQ